MTALAVWTRPTTTTFMNTFSAPIFDDSLLAAVNGVVKLRIKKKKTNKKTLKIKFTALKSNDENDASVSRVLTETKCIRAKSG